MNGSLSASNWAPWRNVCTSSVKIQVCSILSSVMVLFFFFLDVYCSPSSFKLNPFTLGTNMQVTNQSCLLSRKWDTAHVSSATMPVSVGIRQVLKIHQGSLWTNNICCDGARLWLARCGVSLKCVLPSNRVWCPGLFYRPVSSGSWGKAVVWVGCQSNIRDQHILMYLSMLRGHVCVCQTLCITCT